MPLSAQAMAVGAQMKIAHQLRSAEHISQRELERVLAGSFQAAKFDVPLDQMEQMVNGIMKVGCACGCTSVCVCVCACLCTCMCMCMYHYCSQPV